VIAKRSQPGRVADDIAAEELVALTPDDEAPLEATAAPELVLVSLALLVVRLVPVMVAPLPIVERAVQDDEGGSGWRGRSVSVFGGRLRCYKSPLARYRRCIVQKSPLYSWQAYSTRSP